MKITFMPNTYTVEELKVPDLHDRTYCIFDLEGTGINPVEESVTQFGAVYYKKGESLDSSFTSLVLASKPIPEAVAKLTGISALALEHFTADREREMKRFVIPAMYLTAPIGEGKPDE